MSKTETTNVLVRIKLVETTILTGLARLTLLVTAIICAVQMAAAADEKWRPVTPEELAMTVGKVDPNADAEAIFSEVTIDGALYDKITRDTYIRVKILTERGREKFAKVELPPETGDQKIKDLSARVIRPDGSVIEVTEKEIFEKEIATFNGFKVKALSFAFPNIEPGVIVEYRYREVFSFGFTDGMSLDFQLDLPAQVIRYLYRVAGQTKPAFAAFNLEGFDFLKAKNGFYQAENKNVPAFVREPYSIPSLNLRPWILIQPFQTSGQLFRFNTGDRLLMSRLDIKDAEKYWPEHAGQLALTLSSFSHRSSLYDRVAKQVTEGATTNEEKVARLLKFCSDEIKVVAERSPFGKIFMDELLEKREAPASQFYRIFGSLVRSLGLNIGLLNVSSRAYIIFDPSMRNPNFLPDRMLAVEVEPGQWKYYGRDLFYPAGALQWKNEGTLAMLVSNGSFAWLTTPITPAEKSLVKRRGNFRLSSDGSIEGDVRMEYSGHPAAQIRIDYSRFLKLTTGEDPVTKGVKERMPQAVVSEVKYENEKDPEKPLVVNYKISIPKYAERTGKRLFVKPSFFEAGASPIFTASERKHPIDFPYPFSNQDEVNITLPEGYELDSADRPANVADPGNITSLKVSIGIDLPTRTLVYRRNFHFGGGKTPITRFEASSYGALKNLFDMFHKTDNHVIALRATE